MLRGFSIIRCVESCFPYALQFCEILETIWCCRLRTVTLLFFHLNFLVFVPNSVLVLLDVTMKFQILFIVYNLFLSQIMISTNIASSLCQFASVIVFIYRYYHLMAMILRPCGLLELVCPVIWDNFNKHGFGGFIDVHMILTSPFQPPLTSTSIF